MTKTTNVTEVKNETKKNKNIKYEEKSSSGNAEIALAKIAEAKKKK